MFAAWGADHCVLGMGQRGRMQAAAAAALGLQLHGDVALVALQRRLQGPECLRAAHRGRQAVHIPAPAADVPSYFA